MANPALALGEELLALLRQPLTDDLLQRIDQLLDQRAAAVGSVAAEALPLLLQQQRALETEMKRVLEGLGATLRQSQGRGAQIQEAQRILRPQPGARLLSEKR
ncbi:MAG TPA: hypothetical protein VNT01_13935 [Symbiobacteriaceae bacterium]|nr:hypothetical protein [Symbiobacteriaceae bacterium]